MLNKYHMRVQCIRKCYTLLFQRPSVVALAPPGTRHFLQRPASNMANEELNLKHLFDGTNWNVYESNIFNYGVGAPGTDLLQNCGEIFRQATEHRMKIDREENSSMLFQYGPTSGTYEARSAIAKYFTQMYGSEVKCEDLFITSGATQGLHMILSTLVDFNGYIFVDEVTYMIALDSIRQFHTFNIVPLTLTEDGVHLDYFEKLLKEKQFQSTKKEFWAMYYTIPTYHNPTGILFTPQVCEGLIRLARKYDILITCDDVYNILYYKGEKPPQRLLAYDKREDDDFKGNVISNGSFSKIIGPGVRLGWLEMPRRIKTIMDKSGLANSGGCLNNYTSGVVASLFELGLAQKHIELMYKAYKERMLATCEVLEKELPEGCSMFTPSGGYFIWVSLPKGIRALDFFKVCLADEKIFFIAGPRFAVVKGDAENSFRLSIAFHSKENLVEATTRLCKCLKKFLEK